MNQKTLQLLLLVGAAGAALWFFTRGKAAAPGNGNGANTAAQVAQAQAAAQIAQAEAATTIAKLQKDQWYAPLTAGVGEGLGKFLGSLPGLL